MKKLIFVVMMFLCNSVFAQAVKVPVPGAINPAVTQDNIQTNICIPGFTKTIRPPASYTNKLKLKQMKDLGLTGTPHDYEEDHLISLELGGNPTDPNNLWPEPWVGSENAHMKDQIENKLHKMVCAGQITLAEAQKDIATDWLGAYKKYIVPKK